MELQRSPGPEQDAPAAAAPIAKQAGSLYARTVVLENIIRGDGLRTTVTANGRLLVRRAEDDGPSFELAADVGARSVSFRITLPLEARGRQVDEAINDVNSEIARDGHPLLVVRTGRRISVCSTVIDDGRLEDLGNVISYIVMDVFDFAEVARTRVMRVLEDGAYEPGAGAPVMYG